MLEEEVWSSFASVDMPWSHAELGRLHTQHGR